MKNFWKRAAGLALLVAVVACDKDKVNVDPPAGQPLPVTINFGDDQFLAENAGAQDLLIRLERPALHSGWIKVRVQSGFPAAFQTIPAAVNGYLELPVAAGARVITFTIVPVDNASRDGDRPVTFEMAEVSENLTIGSKKVLVVTLTDEELNALPKSYETVGGGWRSKKTFDYDAAGRIKMVRWETETPGLRTGTDTYYYAGNGLVERINRYPGYDEYFYQEDGKIIRSEVVENGVKKAYSLYDYDAAGHVGAEATFYLQPSGVFELGSTTIFLYYENGNIYKQLIYLPQENSAEDRLVSTRTFDAYSDKLNPFPMIEVIPNLSGQLNLPGSYRLEEHGHDLLYYFSYEYREDGRPVKRFTTGSGTSEVTIYEYY